jgi:hypothetical protein
MNVEWFLEQIFAGETGPLGDTPPHISTVLASNPLDDTWDRNREATVRNLPAVRMD